MAARLVQLRSFQQQRLSFEPCILLIMSSLAKARPHNVLHSFSIILVYIFMYIPIYIIIYLRLPEFQKYFN